MKIEDLIAYFEENDRWPSKIEKLERGEVIEIVYRNDMEEFIIYPLTNSLIYSEKLMIQDTECPIQWLRQIDDAVEIVNGKIFVKYRNG